MCPHDPFATVESTSTLQWISCSWFRAVVLRRLSWFGIHIIRVPHTYRQKQQMDYSCCQLFACRFRIIPVSHTHRQTHEPNPTHTYIQMRMQARHTGVSLGWAGQPHMSREHDLSYHNKARLGSKSSHLIWFSPPNPCVRAHARARALV